MKEEEYSQTIEAGARSKNKKIVLV